MRYVGAIQRWQSTASPAARPVHRPERSSPSQNPEPAAQVPMDDAHAARERRSVFLGGGLLAGAALGTAAGTALAGPLGVLLGSTLGAVLGGFAAMTVRVRPPPARA